MTNNRGNTADARLARRTAWAREQLEVGDHASPAEVRARFLTLLRDEQFVPDEASVQAYWALREDAEGIAFAQDPPEFVTAQEAQAAEWVDEFRRQMFKMPPPQRQQRWHELVQSCAWCVQASARLQSFQPALQVDTQALGDMPPLASELARNLIDMFAMPPSRRAVARDRLLQTAQQDLPQWEPAARVIELNYPELAALDTKLVRHIAQARKQQAIAKRQQAKQAKAKVHQTAVMTTANDREISWGMGAFSVIVIAVLAGFVAVATRDSTNKNEPSYRPPYESYDSEKLRRQMDQFEKFQRENPNYQPPRYQPPTSPPPRYQPPTFQPPTNNRPSYQPP